MFAQLRRLRFTTRDVLWLTVVVALICSRYQAPQRKPMTTGRELDVRIHGEGYLVVRHFPSGRFGYTRDGRLSLNACAQICAGRPTTHDCWVIEPSLTFPQPVGTVTIERDGLVSYSQPRDELKTQSGQMQLASFVNPDALNEVADGIFEPTMDSGVPFVTEPGRLGMGYLEQGALEFAPRSVVFNPVYFTCIVCCGAALVCMRKAYPARGTLINPAN